MLNNVNLAGRICKDLELKQTPNGVSVLSFSVAVERDYKNGTERATDFINCVAWRNTAEFISKYFSKGKLIILNGRLEVRKWEDKNGENRYATEVIVDNAYFGGDKQNGTTENNEATENNVEETTDFLPAEDDNLPF